MAAKLAGGARLVPVFLVCFPPECCGSGGLLFLVVVGGHLGVSVRAFLVFVAVAAAGEEHASTQTIIVVTFTAWSR